MSDAAAISAPEQLERLAAWWRANVGDFAGSLTLHKFTDGQSNPTYRVEAGGRRYVMRRKPPGALLPSAHAVDREFRVISALAGTPVPVARARALCTDDSVIGSAFYVMDYVAGRIFWDPTLPELVPEARRPLYAEMARVLAALHAVEPRQVGLADFGKSERYVERQVTRWTQQYRATETERIDAMERLIEWLPQHLPPDGEVRIVHGDYRLDNLIFHPSEPRALALLDWELSTLGDPLVDLAYLCLRWRLPASLRGLAQANLATLQIPTEAEVVTMYCERSGRAPLPPALWDFYLAFCMFRVAGIMQGVYKRALQGNASNQSAALERGRRVQPMAELAWGIVERGLAAT